LARFVIIDGLPYQGTPAKLDTLKSTLSAVRCDFDGYSVDTLVQAMVHNMPRELTAIWDHCVRFRAPKASIGSLRISNNVSSRPTCF